MGKETIRLVWSANGGNTLGKRLGGKANVF